MTTPTYYFKLNEFFGPEVECRSGITLEEAYKEAFLDDDFLHGFEELDFAVYFDGKLVAYANEKTGLRRV